VLACSALKESYRRYLRVSPEVKLVYLRGDYALIEQQLRQRRGHFMDPKLLRSQFGDLEEPQPEEDVAVVKLGRSPRELIEEAKKKLRLR
jgi:gluconokinase